MPRYDTHHTLRATHKHTMGCVMRFLFPLSVCTGWRWRCVPGQDGVDGYHRHVAAGEGPHRTRVQHGGGETGGVPQGEAVLITHTHTLTRRGRGPRVLLRWGQRAGRGVGGSAETQHRQQAPHAHTQQTWLAPPLLLFFILVWLMSGCGLSLSLSMSMCVSMSRSWVAVWRTSL